MEEMKSSDEALSEDKLVLLTAISNNAPMDVVTSLISPSNINVQDEEGNTVLIVVVKKKRWELVPVLLQHGAHVNMGNYRNQTPLHLAARLGAQEDIITRLISPHNINMQDKHGDTVLYAVVINERWDLVSVLLQHGADVNLGDDCKQTPLHLAAWCGAPADIITRLISPHSINMQDEDGDTVLIVAVRVERWDLVPVLLQHGADVNIKGDRNQTPLHFAALNVAPAEIITQLISPHNINIGDEDGDTVLHCAVKQKRWELVSVLLQHGADPYIHDILPEPPRPLSLQYLTIATIRSHMPVKSDEAYESLGLPHILHELKLTPLADEIVAIKQKEDVK